MQTPEGMIIDPRRIRKVENALPVPAKCNCCQGLKLGLVNNSVVYHGKSFGNWPWVYVCFSCWAHVGCHPKTAIPLGHLADQKTRNARKACKPYFISLYNDGMISRNQAYNYLSIKLGLTAATCHFGQFDSDMCHRAKRAAIEIREEQLSRKGGPEGWNP